MSTVSKYQQPSTPRQEMQHVDWHAIIMAGSHFITWRLHLCVRNAETCEHFAAKTNAWNSTDPPDGPCFARRRSTRASAADWLTEATPRGARHA